MVEKTIKLLHIQIHRFIVWNLNRQLKSLSYHWLLTFRDPMRYYNACYTTIQGFSSDQIILQRKYPFYIQFYLSGIREFPLEFFYNFGLFGYLCYFLIDYPVSSQFSWPGLLQQTTNLQSYSCCEYLCLNLLCTYNIFTKRFLSNSTDNSVITVQLIVYLIYFYVLEFQFSKRQLKKSILSLVPLRDPMRHYNTCYTTILKDFHPIISFCSENIPF